MKLEKVEGSENYCCTVVKLPPKQKVEGLDKLVKVTVFGNDCLIGKDVDESELQLFFPAESVIYHDLLSANNLYRDSTRNYDNDKKGFFEDTGRCKTIKFRGVTSTGFIIPITALDACQELYSDGLKEGDEFNTIEGTVLCKKYKIIRQQATTTKESRFNKKLKRFDKLVPNQFRFHESTSHLAKNLHHFNPEDIIVITDKWHGTSTVHSNVLIKKELTIKEKVAKWFGIDVVDKKYDNLYSSRSVIKNQYINKEATAGYYNEDIWGVVNKELEGKIEQGITIYGEIVGYLSSGKMIQKGYDYGCQPGIEGHTVTSEGYAIPVHRVLVYRITYTKPDGNVIEYSWQQIKDYCKKHTLETVKELYFGICGIEDQESFLKTLQEDYLEKDCVHCKNKVPAEGICVRIDGRESYMTYKLKSKRFLEHETKELDKGEENIEDLGEVDAGIVDYE